MSVEGTLPEPSVCCAPSAGSGSSSASGQRVTGAASPPRRHRTGAPGTWSLSFAEAGTRAPRCCSVAENACVAACHRRAHGDSPSRGVWGSHGAEAPAYGNHVRTGCQGTTDRLKKAEKKAKIRSQGVVCLLTTGGLIGVRLGTPHGATVGVPRGMTRICISLWQPVPPPL